MKLTLFTLLLIVNICLNIQQITVSCASTAATTTPTTPLTPPQNNFRTRPINKIRSRTTLLTPSFVSTPTKPSANNSTRTIQRLVGGHIVHYTERPKSNNFYFRRKVVPTSTYGTTTTERYHSNYYEEHDPYDDALLLTDNKIDWEPELVSASAGDGKDVTPPVKKEESKKTLSDQVAEGKYGLIEKELFSTPPKRPGIISYATNKDTPRDTADNLGGLESDDIWLAEDHLLVLKGGGLNERDRQEPWKPIDNYDAPLRQVQIPDNPKVPPPFPVQLEENGPIQFIGNNKFPFFNPFSNESLYFGEGAQKDSPYGPYSPNFAPGFGPLQNSTDSQGYQYPPPFPPWLLNNETLQNPPVNGFPFPPGPFGPPSGPGNFSEPFDEDDPSLYYPPPYSFVYQSNYTNPVSPGPLVPGIVLPPPPNFFSRFRNRTTSTTTTRTPPTIHYRQQLKPVQKLSPTTVATRPTTTTTTTTTTTRRPTHRPPTTTPVYIQEIIPDNRDKYYVKNYNQNIRPTTVTPLQSYQPVTIPVKLSPVVKTITPTTVSFVPKISHKNNVFNNGNPIYYEYFDARQPNANQIVTGNPIETITQLKSTTQVPTVTQIYRKEKPHRRPQNTYLPVKGFDYNKYYYVTPQPEIQPNGISTNFVPNSYNENLSFKPLQPFDQEVENIRQTLQYYKAGQNGGYTQTQTQLPRTPKAKPIYQYEYDPNELSTKKATYAQNIEYDQAPFKPVVQYSSPYNDQNGFRAIPTYNQNTEAIPAIDYYQPQTPNQQYASINRQKSAKSANRFFAPQYRSSSDTPINYYTPRQENTVNFYATGDPIESTTIKSTPWIKIEKQKVIELQPQVQTLQRGYIRNREYYQQPQYYPTNNQYSNQINTLRNQIRLQQNYNSQQQQQQQQRYNQPSLINDTYVNYVNPRPTINPDAEYITIQPPPRFPQSQPIVNINNNANSYYPQRQQQIPPPSLQKDINVNYKYPLPATNPDAEYIQPQQLQQQQSYPQSQQLPYPPPQQQQQTYKQYNGEQHNPVVRYKLPGDRDSHVYFVTPREQKTRGQYEQQQQQSQPYQKK